MSRNNALMCFWIPPPLPWPPCPWRGGEKILEKVASSHGKTLVVLSFNILALMAQNSNKGIEILS